ncbi:uncharacterized protein [Gossypium hirsutum]|uniref:Uncharacterized protein isoform X2 n=1 Tax=Gossypium hirsutum TaxID=3635 RepID=A0A1U8NQH3_GOSHI|nr:uncharacterized protein LOC107950789 isoform X2 [Gossypium hirsutum]
MGPTYCYVWLGVMPYYTLRPYSVISAAFYSRRKAQFSCVLASPNFFCPVLPSQLLLLISSDSITFSFLSAATTASSSSLINGLLLLLHPLAGCQSSVFIFGQQCFDSSYSVGHQYERGRSVSMLLHCLTSLYKKVSSSSVCLLVGAALVWFFSAG